MSTVMRREHTRVSKPRVLAGLLLLAACGDSSSGSSSDAGDEVPDAGAKADAGGGSNAGEDAGDTPEVDAGDAPEVDAGDTGDASEPETDAGSATLGSETPSVVSLSSAGHDRFCGVTFDADGNVYATGYRASTTASDADYALVVAKFLPSGGLDPAFGSAGVAEKNVAVGGRGTFRDCHGGGETARGIVIADGKIYIAGTAEHDVAATGTAANDTDVVLVRFDMDGRVDETFGTEGVVRYDLGTGLEVTTTNASTGATTTSLTGNDVVWSLSVAPGDKLVMHGAQRGEGQKADGSGPRTDLDFVLLRVGLDGALDTSFGGDGKVTTDLAEASTNARSATVLADGSIVAGGYTRTNVLGTETQQPVLYKVRADGTPDADFAAGDFDEPSGIGDQWEEPGVYFGMVVLPPLRAEAYGAALQGDHLVTMGYGPTPSKPDGTGTSDLVSFRFSADGKLDKTYGQDGAAYLDVGGYADNGRALVVLPDHRVLGIGGGRAAPATPPETGTTPPVDALLALFTKDGAPDTSFGEGGVRLYDLGGASDFFFNGALSADAKKLAVVGYRGVTGGQDDAAVLVLSLD